MSARWRILVADDHPIVRRGLRDLLQEAPEVGEVGEAGDAAAVLDAVRRGAWDAIVLDIGMPGRGGLEALRDLKKERPKLPVLVLSVHPEEQYAVRAIRAGVAGYLTNDAAPEHLLEAVRTIVRGRKYLTPAVAAALADAAELDRGEAPHAALSDREFQVLRLFGAGRTVGQIADELALSVKTVSTYRARILEKLGLKTTAELVRDAVTHRLVD